MLLSLSLQTYFENYTHGVYAWLLGGNSIAKRYWPVVKEKLFGKRLANLGTSATPKSNSPSFVNVSWILFLGSYIFWIRKQWLFWEYNKVVHPGGYLIGKRLETNCRVGEEEKKNSDLDIVQSQELDLGYSKVKVDFFFSENQEMMSSPIYG